MRKNGSHGQYFFYLGVEWGFIVGIWVVFCALLFKKGWRIAYFRLVDNVPNKVFICSGGCLFGNACQ
jgi:hypothetical protein